MAVERRLMVMRHAKSSWKDQTLDDHDRPLNKRGRRDAPRIAERLEELGWIPEHVVSSTSERTRQTWAGMASRFPDATTTFTEDLYLSGVEEPIARIAALPAPMCSVLLLGHNPGFEELVEDLVGRDIIMTTANVALLVGRGGTWADALANGFTCVDVLRPKEL